MLSQDEHKAMIMFDRLLMAAKDNETVADLLDQTLNVARMIDPSPDDKVMYGPLQRMHFEWQQMQFRMKQLEQKIDQYIATQNRYGGSTYSGVVGYPQTSSSTSMWPSNPGWDMNAIPTSGHMTSIKPLSKEEIQNLMDNNLTNNSKNDPNWTSITEQLEKHMENLKDQIDKAKPK
jgi:hypothetical protein